MRFRMAQLPNVFNAGQHEKMNDFSVIPAGTRCLVQIIKSEIKDTKAGDGKRLLFQYKVQEGDFKGKLIFIGLNIVNPSEVAVEISQKELASICEVCGKVTVTDSQELHGVPFYVTVGVEESEGYPPKNIVTKYEKAGSDKPASNPFA